MKEPLVINSRPPRRRVLAAVAGIAVVASGLTVPASALAADSSGEDRIYLQPAAPDAGTDPDAGEVGKAASQATSKAAVRSESHPPLARAKRVDDLQGLMRCRTSSDRSWAVLSGPADVQVGGWAQCQGTTWVFRVVAGAGHVGGMTLRSDDFTGTLRIDRAGRTSGSIGARLPWPGSVLPDGKATARLNLLPVESGLIGDVAVRDASTSAVLAMKGRVPNAGPVALQVSGSVDFAGQKVAMSGTYRTGANGVRARGAQPSWLIRGGGRDLRIPGATFVGPRLVVSSQSDGIKGEAQARLTQPRITAPVALTVTGPGRWSATFDGSNAGTLRDERLSGLTLLADEVTGVISGIGKNQRWLVRVPMRLVDGKLALRGIATLSGPNAMRLAPSAGSGDLFGTGRPVVFTKAVGSATITGSKVTGRMGVSTPGEQLFDMPEGWSSATVLQLTPRFTGSGSATLDRGLGYLVTQNGSRIMLSGDLPASGPFRLSASGYTTIGSTRVPVRGTYVGNGPRRSGSPGQLRLTANTDQAPNGYADLGSGARAVGTTLVLATDPTASTQPAVSTRGARALGLPTVTVTSTSNTSTSGGTVTLEVSDINTSSGDDSVSFNANWTYVPAQPATATTPAKAGYYKVTIKGTGTAYWEPYDGLEIPYSSISGTITADDSTSVTSWNITVNPAVTWKTGDGITLTSSLTLSSNCTKDMVKTSCPTPAVPGTFFVSGKSAILDIPVMAGVTIPSLSAYGAFRSDGLWARWDAQVATGDLVEVDAGDASITLSNAEVALYSSAQNDDSSAVPASLVMPDLSALSKSGMNLQACGSFKIEIFEVSTGNVPGCVALTKQGKVIGQSKTNGTPDGGGVNSDSIDDHEGLTLPADDTAVQVNGYAYSDIDTKSTPTKTNPTVTLYNKVISLAPKQSNFTANVTIPGKMMESFGTGSSAQTVFVATGWFSKKTNELYIDLDIPVDLRASGVHLEDINLSIDRRSSSSVPSYDFQLDASGEVAIESHHYPFDAKIEATEGTDDYAAVSLAVIGETNSQPIGSFDDSSLLPDGGFEPASDSLIDGTFDGPQQANDFNDGGFEASTFASNLIPNGSFEDSASFNLLPEEQSSFSGDTSGNILPNADYEEFDVLYNGDFEGVDGLDTPDSASDVPLGWTYAPASGLKTYVKTGDATGGTVVCVDNSSTSAQSYSTGVYQMTRPGVVNGATYKVTGWVRDNNGGSSSSQKAMVSFSSSSSSYLSASSDVTVPDGAWQSFELTGKATGSYENAVVNLYLSAGKGSMVCFDRLTFQRTSGDLAEFIGGVKKPDYVEMFDGSTSSWNLSMSSGVQRINLGGDNNALKTDGCNDYWTFNPSSRGDILDNKVPWDMSVNVYLRADSSEERADIGFLLTDNGTSSANGYFYRLKNSGSSDDGGFYSVKSGKVSGFGGGVANISKNTWYNVRMIGWGTTQIYIQITNLQDGTIHDSNYINNLPAVGQIGGGFGQYADTKCQKDNDVSYGSYWDDFQVRTASTGTGVIQDAMRAHSGSGVAKLAPGGSGWATYTSVGESITQGQTYTYSAWVKGDKGTVTGNVAMKGVSDNWAATTETIASRGFSATNTAWTQVRVTWTADRDYSDMAVGFTGMSSGSSIYVDDQAFQQMPYARAVANGGTLPMVDVLSDPQDATNNVMSYAPADSNPSAVYYDVGKPFATTTYHATARVRTISGASEKIALKIYDGDGKTVSSSTYTVGKDDTTIGPVDLTSSGGNGNLRVSFEVAGASQGFYIDNVDLTATETTSSEATGGNSDGTLGKLPAITDWNYSSSTSVQLVNDPANARSDQAYMRVGGGQVVGRQVAVNGVKGQTYRASVWLKAPSGNTTADVYLIAASGNNFAPTSARRYSVPITSSGYTEVPLVLTLVDEGMTIDNMRLQIVNDGSNPLAVDDVSLALDGLALVDPWKVSGNAGLVVYDDSTNAHLSEDYLAVTGDSGASIRIEPTVKAATTARTFSAWVRSPSGTVSGTLSLSQADGGTASVDFTADTTWRQVIVTLNGVTTSSAKAFASTITLKQSGTLWVDDLITRDLAPFVPSASGVTVGIVEDPIESSSPPNYLLVSAPGGKGITAPTPVTSPILGGATFTVRAHVRAVSGTVSGTIGLDFGTQAGAAISPQLQDGDSANFTADDTWQQVTATFQAPSGSFTTLAPKFTFAGSGGTLHVDTVSVSPVKIELQQPWQTTTSSSSQAVTWGVWDDPSNAFDNSLGVMKFSTLGSSDAGMSSDFTRSVQAGEVYSATVWARTDPGKTASLTAELRARGSSANPDEAASTSTTLTGDWQAINVRLPIAKTHSSMRFTLTTTTPGVQIYVDDVSVVQNMWSVTDSGNRTNIVTNPSLETDISGYVQQNGSTLTRTDYHAYTGNYSGELKAADPTRQGYVVYPLSTIKPSTTYTVSAYVWVPDGATASDLPQGYDFFWFVDYGDSSKNVASVIKTVPPDYTKTMQWQRVSITMTTSAAPNANVRFMAPWDGGWYVDGLLVEEGSDLSGYFEGTRPATTLTVMGDGPGAYEGSGYAQLSTVNAAGASMSAVAAGSLSGYQDLTAYVRSANGEPVSGYLSLAGGCNVKSGQFTVTDEWEKVVISCTISGSQPLTMSVTATTPGGVLDVDSIRLSNEPEDPISYGDIFGVTSPLDHPETGYHYLWDDAFGIPGMHLWGFAVQVEIDEAGEPGLGVQATVYQDPTRAGGILYGTDWIKGDAVLNIDEVSPCFKFGFTSVSETGQPLGNSGLSIAEGALKAEDFDIAFAPRGCAVGNYKVPPGASVFFDALVGDGTLHFDLDLSKNSKNQPQFDGDLHVTELNIGGIEYRDLEMAVHASPTDDSVTYKADMQLPLGGFKGDFEMVGATVGADQGVHVDGSVELTDWGWESAGGKGLQVDVFDFDVHMDVGPTNCGTLEADAKANSSADFAEASNLDFDGHLKVVCGLIEDLSISFDYTHGDITEDFYLSYDAEALTLAGGVEFQFQRKESWKYLTYRYHRTARIGVSMDFFMDVTDPSSSEAELAAWVKIANGSGSADCTITGQPSDSCTIHISIDTPVLGKQSFTETW